MDHTGPDHSSTQSLSMRQAMERARRGSSTAPFSPAHQPEVCDHAVSYSQAAPVHCDLASAPEASEGTGRIITASNHPATNLPYMPSLSRKPSDPQASHVLLHLQSFC
jgi:hypothetical protein